MRSSNQTSDYDMQKMIEAVLSFHATSCSNGKTGKQMMNAVIVRYGRNWDINGLCRLYSEFHEFHVKGVPERLRQPPSYDNEELRTKLTEILKSRDSTILVAELDGQIIGLAEVYIKEDEPSPYTMAYSYALLQSMVVSEEYKRQNVGARLLHAVEQWAKARGASEIRLNTWEFEAGPLRFYEKHGYRTLRRVMVRKLCN